MPSYLVETILASAHAGERGLRERRAHSAAEELTKRGTPVRFDNSTRRAARARAAQEPVFAALGRLRVW